MSERIVESTIIDAPVAIVWENLTQPELMRAWMGEPAMPVFARAGAIVPMQPPSDYSDAKPLDTLILHVFGDGDGSFSLYEDDGISLDYDQGGHAITAMHHTTGQDGGNELTIDAAQGEFKGQVQRRAYELRVHMAKKPSALSVNGKPGPAWRWNAKEGVATATVPTRSVHEAVHLSWH